MLDNRTILGDVIMKEYEKYIYDIESIIEYGEIK